MSLPKIKLSQQGFAIIPLIILMLFGIAAGTLLVQNGINFLPKAQSWPDPEPWNPVNDDFIRIRYDSVCHTSESGESLRNYQIKHGSTLLEANRVACQKAGRPCTDYMKQYCGIRGMICTTNSGNLFEGYCSKAKYVDPNQPLVSCTLEQAKSQPCVNGRQLKISHCDYKTNTNIRVMLDNCLDTEEPQNYNYYCLAFDTTVCRNAAPAQAAPAAQSAASSTDLADWNPPDDNAYRIKYASGCFTHATGQSVRLWVVKKGKNTVEATQGACDGANRPCSGLSNWCTDAGQQCIKDDNFQAHCGSPTQAAPATQPTSSTTEPGVKGDCPANRQLPCEQGMVCKIDQVDTRWCVDKDKKEGDSCGNNCIIIGGLRKTPYPANTPENGCNAADKETCDPKYNEECAIYKKNINNKDYWYSACRKKAGSAQAPAPAAGQPASGARPAAGAPAQSAGGKVNVTECTNPTHTAYCAKSSQKCYLINGDAKCAFTTSATTCNSDDTSFCSSKGGCTFETVTIVKPDKTEEQIKVSKCSNNQTAPGAAGTTSRPVNSSQGNPSSGAGSAGAGSAAAPAPVSDLICGKDDKGIDIPCYAMGVFSPGELTARESQAQIASVNYAKFRKIIDDQEAKIGAQVANAARQKIAAAEEAMKACIK